MEKIILYALLLLLSVPSFAQGRREPILTVQKEVLNSNTNKIESRETLLTYELDSMQQHAASRVDTIRSAFQSQVDSLQLAYQRPINKLDSTERSLQHKIDSLRSLRLPNEKLTAKYRAKLDSVTRAKTQSLTELNQKVEGLKVKAIADLKELNLPPELQGPVKNLEQSIQGYKIPMVNGQIPNLNIPGGRLPGLLLPSGQFNMNSPGNVKIPGVGTGANNPLNDISKESKELSNVTSQVGGYTKDVQNIAKGEMNEVKNLDKAAESQAMKMQGMSELKGKNGELGQYQKQLNGRPDSAAMNMVKQEGIKELTKEAANHFAGQEAVLKETMGKMSKLKLKYNDVKSVAELPKKLPNPLYKTPLIERIIPGLTFQLYNSTNFLMDINPVVLYRISPRFSAGPGWVERIGFGNHHGQHRSHVYGPRTVIQFAWARGFSLRFVPEVLNTYVPQQFIQTRTPGDAGQRQWVASAFVGLKKEFAVYKRIKGNTEAMYNLYDPQNKSPYPDRLVVRFGFEFPMKKKVPKK